MRGRSSSKQWKSGKEVGEGSMEIDKVDKGKEEPHLSGAYIRSLVKHLTSSRTKDPLDGDGDVGLLKDLGKSGVCIGDQSQPPPIQQPQHKKQVRRRLHTSRPYQERLLNMAEARREIVTALKFHRASMKHQEANNNHDHQSQPLPPPSQQMNSKSRRPYASATSSASIPGGEFMANNFCSDPLSCPPPLPYFWPISPPPLLIPENLNFPLPDQTLGLNLNFQEFNNLDTTFYHSPVSMHSSPSTCSSAAISSVTTGEIEQEAVANRVVLGGGGGGGGGGGVEGGDVLGGGLHQAMDDGEMEEIRSLGEQHQMEWNDTLNLMTSARWFKFLKTMEIGPEVDEKGNEDEDDDNGYSHPFDQVMEFPPWLVNANESCCLHQESDYRFSDDYFQDPSLPCMDIGEIEGIDGEWLD